MAFRPGDAVSKSALTGLPGRHHRLHAEPFIVRGYDDMAETVRRGQSAHNSVAPEHPIWVDFARHMAPMMRPLAMLMAGFLELGSRPAKILDIAAGHGLFGIACAERAPEQPSSLSTGRRCWPWRRKMRGPRASWTATRSDRAAPSMSSSAGL